jgi:hypothetical protein
MANYIHQLQDTVSRLESQVREQRDIVNDLRRYLNSSKFRCGDELDGYVNVSDVLERLKHI